jgi:probable HAF family extracellular repeat protein
MKVQLFTLVTLLALALIAAPVLAQDSAKPSLLHNPIAKLLRPGSLAKSGHAPAAGQDAVAKGLAKAKAYKFQSADYPGADTNYVFDKNSTIILGDAAFSSGAFSFTLMGNNYTQLNVPGSSLNESTGINTSGQIVGVYADLSNVIHGFLDTGGVFTTIDVPGANSGTTEVLDINDSGEFVGGYEDSGNVNRGFSTTDGISFVTLSYPGATSTLAAGVNGAGTIVGQWEDALNVDHGFVYQGGVFTPLDFPLSTSTTAIGINDAGEIAGWFTDAGGASHGFLYTRGAYTQVDVGGAKGTELTRAKNNGNITGIYTDNSDETHGVVGR